MGNQITNKEKANAEGQKIVLSLRCRDIILHYSFKMKASITDISLFPHGLQGLKLWDSDVILSRFVILQNERFGNKTAFVFKGGVGLIGITLSKWGGCRKVDMCDTRGQVVGNMKKNCQRNQTKNVECFEVNLTEFSKYAEKYDFALATDLFSQGFQPQVILNIWRKVLKVGGQSIMVMPEKKEQAKKLLQIVDRSEFKITNMVLTAQEYEASPLLNKLQGQSEFPQIGKINFYAIILTKLAQKLPPVKKQGQELKETNERSQINRTKSQLKKTGPIVQDTQKQSNLQKTGSPKKQEQIHQATTSVPVCNQPIQKQSRDQSPIKSIRIESFQQESLPKNQPEKQQNRLLKEPNNAQQLVEKDQHHKVEDNPGTQEEQLEKGQIQHSGQKEPISQGL